MPLSGRKHLTRDGRVLLSFLATQNVAIWRILPDQTRNSCRPSACDQAYDMSETNVIEAQMSGDGSVKPAVKKTYVLIFHM